MQHQNTFFRRPSEMLLPFCSHFHAVLDVCDLNILPYIAKNLHLNKSFLIVFLILLQRSTLFFLLSRYRYNCSKEIIFRYHLNTEMTL